MPHAESVPLLEVQGLTIHYEDAVVVNDVSLSLQRGQFGCLIGPNGAGKSTLLKALVGLVPVSHGTIEIRTPRVGYVPQGLALDKQMKLTVAEFLSLRASQKRPWWGPGSASVQERITRRLEEIGAAHLYSRPLGKLSGGEFQRVLIAYSLLRDPELLLLDEPLTGLDVRGGLSFDGILHHLQDHCGMTILMVSHDLHLVEHLGDVVFCLNSNLCCHGAPGEVLRPENLARAYGHLPGMAADSGGGAFIPLRSIH
jgi:zinc transport system ATP-binding protein